MSAPQRAIGGVEMIDVLGAFWWNERRGVVVGEFKLGGKTWPKESGKGAKRKRTAFFRGRYIRADFQFARWGFLTRCPESLLRIMGPHPRIAHSLLAREVSGLVGSCESNSHPARCEQA